MNFQTVMKELEALGKERTKKYHVHRCKRAAFWCSNRSNESHRYVPLHEKAIETAKAVGLVEVKRDNKKSSSILNAYESIQKEVDKRRIGFKWNYVKC